MTNQPHSHDPIHDEQGERYLARHCPQYLPPGPLSDAAADELAKVQLENVGLLARSPSEDSPRPNSDDALVDRMLRMLGQ